MTWCAASGNTRKVWRKDFTKKHGIKMLVYYEVADAIEAAIHREKIIKTWKRAY
jgi:predicted GIY-YIG superfamily endonuclease